MAGAENRILVARQHRAETLNTWLEVGASLAFLLISVVGFLGMTDLRKQIALERGGKSVAAVPEGGSRRTIDRRHRPPLQQYAGRRDRIARFDEPPDQEWQLRDRTLHGSGYPSHDASSVPDPQFAGVRAAAAPGAGSDRLE